MGGGGGGGCICIKQKRNEKGVEDGVISIPPPKQDILDTFLARRLITFTPILFKVTSMHQDQFNTLTVYNICIMKMRHYMSYNSFFIINQLIIYLVVIKVILKQDFSLIWL